MRFRRLIIVFGMAFVLGCGPTETTQTVTPPQNPIKPTLESIADTGVVDSGTVLVREELEKMKSTDSAKAEDLLKDLDQLESMNDPAAIKAKAKAMVGKL